MKKREVCETLATILETQPERGRVVSKFWKWIPGDSQCLGTPCYLPFDPFTSDEDSYNLRHAMPQACVTIVRNEKENYVRCWPDFMNHNVSIIALNEKVAVVLAACKHFKIEVGILEE